MQEAKSVIISRKPGKSKELYTAVLSFFDANDPHLKACIPKDITEYENITKININDFGKVNYYLLGNDIVINNLEKIIIKHEENTLNLTGIQNIN